jgi:hypothetical protein
MAINNSVLEGDVPKLYRLWHVGGPNEFIALVAEADTFEEIISVRRRKDWRYLVTRNGAPVDLHAGFPILTLPGQDSTVSP